MTAMAALKPANFLWRMEGDVAVIQLSRPERKNPLTFEILCGAAGHFPGPARRRAM